MILLSLGLLSTNSKRVKITFFYVEKAALKKKMVGKITKMCTLKIFIGEFICHVYKKTLF